MGNIYNDLVLKVDRVVGTEVFLPNVGRMDGTNGSVPDSCAIGSSAPWSADGNTLAWLEMGAR